MRKTCRSAVLAVVLAALVFAQSAYAQVLQLVPADALVVLKVNNVQQTSQKIAKWSEAIGLSAFVPQMADPLGALQGEMKIQQGLDKAGEMAFIFLNPEKVGGEDNAMLVLIPVTDYKAFAAQLPGAAAEGNLTKFKAHDGEKELRVANWGKYAAVSATAEVLNKKPQGVKLPPSSAKEVAARDAVVWANITALREIALPQLQQSREQIVGEIEKGMNNPEAPKEFIPVVKALVHQSLNLAERFLKESDSALLSLNFTDEGLRVAALAEFQPESYLGGIAKNIQGTNEGLIKGLPERDYFAVVGVDIRGDGLQKFATDFATPITKELAQIKGGEQVNGVVQAMQRMMKASKNSSIGYAVPTAPLGQEGLIQAVTVIQGDSAIIAEGQRTVLKAYTNLLGALPQQGGGQIKMNLAEGAKTVDGVKLDQFTFSMQAGDAAQQQQMAMVMGFIYGPGGMGGVMGPVGPNAYIAVQGGTDALLKEAIAAAKANKDVVKPLKNAAAVTKNLPQNRFATAYIDLVNIVTTAGNTAAAFGAPVKLNFPPNLPPIGMAAASEGSAVRFDTFVPNTTVQALVRTGLETYTQMQGGGQGQGGAAPGGL